MVVIEDENGGLDKRSAKQTPVATKSVSEVSITSKLPFIPVDGHRITTSRSVQSVDLELIQFTGGGEAITVSAIRLPASHALKLAESILEQVNDLVAPKPLASTDPANPPNPTSINEILEGATPCSGKKDTCINGYLCNEHKYRPKNETQEERLIRLNKTNAVIVNGVIYRQGEIEAFGRLTT